MTLKAKITLGPPPNANSPGGLHLTPCVQVVEALKKLDRDRVSVRFFHPEWSMETNGHPLSSSISRGVDGFSALDLISLGLCARASVYVVCDGEEASEAITILRRLFTDPQSRYFAGSSFEDVEYPD